MKYNERINTLSTKYQGLIDKLDTILTEAGDNPLTDEQELEYLDIEKRAGALTDQIEHLKKAQELARSAPAAQPVVSASIISTPEDQPFESLGEQLSAIAMAEANPRGGRDPRLVWDSWTKQASSGVSTETPSEGGYLIQTDFSNKLFGLMHEQGDILRRVTTANLSEGYGSLVLPYIDETERSSGNRWGGVSAHWANDATNLTPSTTRMGRMEVSPSKLIALAYLTEEVMREAPLMEKLVRQAITEELVFKTEEAILFGDGVGKPLGCLTSLNGGLITVSKSADQGTDELISDNVIEMYSRLHPRSRRKAVWFINPDVEPSMYRWLRADAVDSFLYVPPSGDGNARLLGRPVIPIEYCESLGTQNDIVLADLSSYLLLRKGGTRGASSMHVRFFYEEMVFRVSIRVGGMSLARTPVTPYKGTWSTSPFVTIEDRP
jgi:HK97 family phage major capsid protein